VQQGIQITAEEGLRFAKDGQHLHTSDLHNEVSDNWIQFSKDNLLVVREKSAKYFEQINASHKEAFLIPSLFARVLKMNKSDVLILGMGGVVGDVGFTEIDPTPKMSFLLKEVLSSLAEMKYIVPYDIYIAEFESERTMGHADIEGKKIYLAASSFDMGRREIAMTIMEEAEHIKSKAHDETREFETHIFSQWLKSMEEANGLFL